MKVSDASRVSLLREQQAVGLVALTIRRRAAVQIGKVAFISELGHPTAGAVDWPSL